MATATTSRPAPAPKPKNVDKVDFGKTKTIVDTGVYHRPKPIAAATGRDLEPPKPKKTEQEQKARKEAEKKHPIIMEAYKYLEKKQEDTKKFAESPAGHVVGEVILDTLTGGAAELMSVARKVDRYVAETKEEKPLMVKAEEAVATAVYTAGRTVVDIGSAILKGGAIVQGVYPKEDSESSSEEGA